MTIGTGIALLGVWVTVGAVAVSKRTTGTALVVILVVACVFSGMWVR